MEYLRAVVEKYDKPLGVAFLVGLCGLWFYFYTEQEAAYPGLHAVGLRSWGVTCQGDGRTYRLQSENISGYRSGASVIRRSLSIFNDAGDELYYTQRFDPDAYESHDVWSFRAGWDNRLFAPRRRSGEVLHGDEQRFEIGAGLGGMTIVTKEGGRLGLDCKRW